KIRHRGIFEDLQSKRQGGFHAHSLEEQLTRRDRPRVFTKALFTGRDAYGRFVAASAVTSLRSPTSDRPWMDYALVVNGTTVQTGPAPGDMPLLWILRDKLNLKGTKYGCGIGACGACTIHLDGQSQRACQVQVATVGAAQRITTIEGLSTDGSHPLQKA